MLAVAGEEVTTLADFYKRVWARGAAGVEVPIRVLRGAQLQGRQGALDRPRRVLPAREVSLGLQRPDLPSAEDPRQRSHVLPLLQVPVRIQYRPRPSRKRGEPVELEMAL